MKTIVREQLAHAYPLASNDSTQLKTNNRSNEKCEKFSTAPKSNRFLYVALVYLSNLLDLIDKR